MDITITAKIKISPTIEQAELLKQTISAYRSACNYVSALIHETKILLQVKLYNMAYRPLRENYSMRSQMAQSVIKTVS